MQYHLYVKHQGGCDSTIACGEKLILLEAYTYAEALAKVKNWCEDNSSYLDPCSGPTVKIIEILEVSAVITLDPKDLLYREQPDDVDPERAEYERLKLKFGQ